MLRASLARDGKTSLATIAGRSHMPTSYISISFASTLILVLGDCASATKAQKAAADPEETSPSAVQQPRVQTTTQQVVICTQTAEGTKSKAAAQGLTTAARELAKLKAKVMAADYRANLEELARLREELSPWRKDNEVGYLAYYWSGFASWRIAINGANHQMKEEDLTTNLRKATTDLYSAMRLKDDFADTYAAAALVNSWLAMMVDRDERLSLARALLAHGTALDPENPRVLWTKGAFLFYAPEQYGGSIPGAIEVYKQMLKVAERRGVNAESPCPDWGKPEALMSLAVAHTKLKPPDLKSAREEATAALKLEPEWSYVRDNLLPNIEQQLGADRSLL